MAKKKAKPTAQKEIKKQGTTIYENARRALGVTRDQYAFCEYVVYRCADPRQKFAGWCCDPKEEIADFVGISRVGLFKMAREMEAFGLVEISGTGAYRGTAKWMDIVSGCKQSLQNGTKADVNKVNIGRKQSLQKARLERKQSLHAIKRELDIKEKEREGEGKTPPPPASYDEMLERVNAETSALEAKKEKAPPVAPPPPKLTGEDSKDWRDLLYEADERRKKLLESDPSDFDIYSKVPLTDMLEDDPGLLVNGFDTSTLPGAMIRTAEIMPTNPLPISLNMRPNANTPMQLRIAMENFYRDWPLEWSDGVLEISTGRKYSEERQQEIFGLWACHAIKLNHGGNTYMQLNADLQKWFRGQKDFDRNYNTEKPKNGFSQPETKYTPPPASEKIPAYTP